MISISNVLEALGTVWLRPEVDSSKYLLGTKLLAGGGAVFFST